MTYTLREAWFVAAQPLPAPITLIIAITAPAALGLSDEPFHARAAGVASSCYRVTSSDGRSIHALRAGPALMEPTVFESVRKSGPGSVTT
jgi:hypothetical protein